MCFDNRYCTGECPISFFLTCWTYFPIRSFTLNGSPQNEPARSDPSELGFVPTIVADMALLLIILAGLFVLRRNGGGTFGLARLVWRQVKWRFSLALVRLCLLNFLFSRGLFGSYLAAQLRFYL